MAEVEPLENTALKTQDPVQPEQSPEGGSSIEGRVEQSADEVQEAATSDEELSAEELDEMRANEVAYSWEASEYVHHQKGPGWYWALVALLIVLTGTAALLHYWLEILAFVAMGGAIVVYARKPPRTLLYELTPSGLVVDGRNFPFTDFRSFGVLSDIEWHTIDLEPIKRFSPRLSVLFEDDDFDVIVGHLELHLPQVDRDPDVVERLTRLLRF